MSFQETLYQLRSNTTQEKVFEETPIFIGTASRLISITSNDPNGALILPDIETGLELNADLTEADVTYWNKVGQYAINSVDLSRTTIYVNTENQLEDLDLRARQYACFLVDQTTGQVIFTSALSDITVNASSFPDTVVTVLKLQQALPANLLPLTINHRFYLAYVNTKTVKTNSIDVVNGSVLIKINALNFLSLNNVHNIISTVWRFYYDITDFRFVTLNANDIIPSDYVSHKNSKLGQAYARHKVLSTTKATLMTIPFETMENLTQALSLLREANNELGYFIVPLLTNEKLGSTLKEFSKIMEKEYFWSESFVPCPDFKFTNTSSGGNVVPVVPVVNTTLQVSYLASGGVRPDIDPQGAASFSVWIKNLPASAVILDMTDNWNGQVKSSRTLKSGNQWWNVNNSGTLIHVSWRSNANWQTDQHPIGLHNIHLQLLDIDENVVWSQDTSYDLHHSGTFGMLFRDSYGYQSNEKLDLQLLRGIVDVDRLNNNTGIEIISDKWWPGHITMSVDPQYSEWFPPYGAYPVYPDIDNFLIPVTVSMLPKVGSDSTISTNEISRTSPNSIWNAHIGEFNPYRYMRSTIETPLNVTHNITSTITDGSTTKIKDLPFKVYLGIELYVYGPAMWDYDLSLNTYPITLQVLASDGIGDITFHVTNMVSYYTDPSNLLFEIDGGNLDNFVLLGVTDPYSINLDVTLTNTEGPWSNGVYLEFDLEAISNSDPTKSCLTHIRIYS